MSDQVQTESTIYNEPGVYYPQATVGGYTATFEPGVTVDAPLSAPTGVTATSSSDTSVTVAWDAVEGAASYNVTYWRTDTPDQTQMMPADASPAEVTGLETGIEYSFTVNGVTAEGAHGEASEPVTATPGGGGQQLATPQNVQASNIASTSATISWDAVTGADQYSVTYTPGGATPQTVTDPTIDLTGLTDGIEYTVSVVAQDTTGGSTDSDPGTVTFTAGQAQLPAPTNVAVSNIADTTADVSWNAVTGADGYNISWALASDPTTPVGSDTSAASPYSMTGLAAGTDYIVSVVATDSTGAAADSDPTTDTFTTTGTAQLPTPQNGTASAITDTSATIGWDAVTGADGYSVTYEPGGATPQTVTTPTIDLTGLTPGTAYTVSIVATDSTGAMADSEPGTAAFTTTGTASLAAPTNITASNVTAETAVVSWDAVAGADGYSVNYTPGGTEMNVSDPTINLEGLTASTEYTVSVVATDSTGAAGDSDPGIGTFTTTA